MTCGSLNANTTDLMTKITNILTSITKSFLLTTAIALPILTTAQLKEFEVSEMDRPDVPVVQANVDFPDDAIMLVYSSLKDLNFRSSLGAIDKVSYNSQSNRYEVFFKPNKQMLFVYASNFVEQKIETFNPNPKDELFLKEVALSLHRQNLA